MPLGVVLGFIFQVLGNIIYNVDLGVVAMMGVQSYRNPAAWIARGIAWGVFGVAGGIVYGIVGQSGQKTKYGIIGGAIGAAIGGMVFDPIAMLTKGGGLSRAVGFSLVGLATGAVVGCAAAAAGGLVGAPGAVVAGPQADSSSAPASNKYGDTRR